MSKNVRAEIRDLLIYKDGSQPGKIFIEGEFIIRLNRGSEESRKLTVSPSETANNLKEALEKAFAGPSGISNHKGNAQSWWLRSLRLDPLPAGSLYDGDGNLRPIEDVLDDLARLKQKDPEEKMNEIRDKQNAVLKEVLQNVIRTLDEYPELPPCLMIRKEMTHVPPAIDPQGWEAVLVFPPKVRNVRIGDWHAVWTHSPEKNDYYGMQNYDAANRSRVVLIEIGI